jgi:predicted lipoprotein with Yx(FWY)xxD motif
MRSISSGFRIRAIAAIGGVLLIVSACSSAGSSPSASTAAVVPSNAPSSTAPSAAGGGGTTVVAVATGDVGTFLTGVDGKTLYTFAADSANKTACVDACATKWPPFVIETGATVSAGAGVTGTLATFARPDGKMQVTYNGIPLYYYGGDGKAGDTTGQGFGGKWFVASATGTPGSPAPSTVPPTSKGGY